MKELNQKLEDEQSKSTKLEEEMKESERQLSDTIKKFEELQKELVSLKSQQNKEETNNGVQEQPEMVQQLEYKIKELETSNSKVSEQLKLAE